MLYVLCWRQTCCLLKSAQESTFAHSGLCGHRGNAQSAYIRLLKPLLNLEYRFVAMVQLWREVRVETLLATRNIHKKEPGSLKHNGRTQEAIDKFQSQIDPSHEAPRRNDVPVIVDHFFSIDPNFRKSLSERL